MNVWRLQCRYYVDMNCSCLNVINGLEVGQMLSGVYVEAMLMLYD